MKCCLKSATIAYLIVFEVSTGLLIIRLFWRSNIGPPALSQFFNIKRVITLHHFTGTFRLNKIFGKSDNH